MSQWYYVDTRQQRQGPAAAADIAAAYRSGMADGNSLVWREGLAEWQKLSQHAMELGIDLSAPRTAPAATTIIATPGPMPAATVVTPTVTPAAVAAATPVATPVPASIPTPQNTPVMPAAAPADAPVQTRKHGGMGKGCLIAALVGFLLLLVVAGVLVALALPAYRDYVVRAEVAMAINEGAVHKLMVSEFYLAQERCPNDAAEAGLVAGSARVQAVNAGRYDNGQCGVELVLAGFPEHPEFEGQRIWFSFDPQQVGGGTVNWTCSSSVEARYLPAGCQPP
jgi:type IV pilus assembly protein PilA